MSYCIYFMIINTAYVICFRRLESLENPSAPPITIYQQNSKLQKLRSGLAPADLQILERLERLREDRNKIAPPSESEIRHRLANLKGENPYVEEPKKTVTITVYIFFLIIRASFTKLCIY